MSKREKILFIKYIHECIKHFESNPEKIIKNFNILQEEINTMTDKLNVRSTYLKNLFPNDNVIALLTESEVTAINLYFVENQKDKKFILDLLNTVDLAEPIETIKYKNISAIEQKQSKSKYFYQLSEIIYGCLTS